MKPRQYGLATVQLQTQSRSFLNYYSQSFPLWALELHWQQRRLLRIGTWNDRKFLTAWAWPWLCTKSLFTVKQRGSRAAVWESVCVCAIQAGIWISKNALCGQMTRAFQIQTRSWTLVLHKMWNMLRLQSIHRSSAFILDTVHWHWYISVCNILLSLYSSQSQDCSRRPVVK